MAIEFEDPVTAGTVLIREAIQSQNFLTGVAGWQIKSNGDAEFNGVIIRGELEGPSYIINAAGAFFYDGPPANGNLIVSIAGASGTDAFGNNYPIGFGIENSGFLTVENSSGVVGVQIGGQFAQIIGYSQSGITEDTFIRDGILHFGDASNQTRAASIFSTAGGTALLIQSRTTNTLTTYSQIYMQPGLPSVTGATDVPHIDIGAPPNSAVDLRVSGSVVKTDNSGVPEVWGTPAYNANWLASTTFNGSTAWGSLQFRKDSFNNVVVIGSFKAGAVLPGSTVFQFPVGYRPQKQWPLTIQRNNGGTLTFANVGISTAGNFNLLAATGNGMAINNEYLVSGSFPLGDLP